MRVAIIDPSCFSMPYDYSLCEGLVNQGCKVTFIGTQIQYSSWNHPEKYERWNHFYRFTNYISNRKGFKQKYIKGIEHIFGMERLIHRIRKWGPDIIHFQWLPLPGVDCWFLPRLRKIAPLVLTVHDTQPFHGSPSSNLQLWKYSQVYRSFDHYIVHTEFSQSELFENSNISPSQISVISHGVFDYYNRIKGPPQLNNNILTKKSHKTVLFFGVIKPYKGLDLLIEAFSRLPYVLRKNTQLFIVGHPQIPIKPFEMLAVRLGISEHIKWDLRFIPEVEVADIFKLAYVVALPYRRIDQSGVLMTALAFGKPLIATKIGGFVEILKDGVHGYLIKPACVDSLTKSLEIALTHPDVIHEMGDNIRTLAKGELSWDTIAQKTIFLYKTICNNATNK